MARILVVGAQCAPLASPLRAENHEVVTAATEERALALAADGAWDALVVDPLSGEGAVGALRQSAPDAAILALVPNGDVATATALMREGASDCLAAPVDPGAMRAHLRSLLDRDGAPAPRAQAANHGILGHSARMRDLLELVDKVADTDSTVLITGETGTGKELIGRAVHRASRRSIRPLCAVNSAGFPETLLESELFGHRRGSFTGATANKKGLFEYADRGTVFLDEVAEMPLSMQAKLLRFLQTGEIRPVGSETTRVVDVRLVAATNKDLEREIEEGRFREDLYYRLAVIPLHVPPLRERSDDVPLLADAFLERFAAQLGKSVRGIEEAALQRLVAYDWPGNVRELENLIERGVALCQDELIRLEDLPARVHAPRRPVIAQELLSLEDIERQHILGTLERVSWNRKRAAEILKISTTTLWRRLKEFGVEEERRRGATAVSCAGPR